MTQPALSTLQNVQWGLETISTHGTAVAATSRIACEGIEFTALDMLARPRLAKGYLLANPGNEMPIRRGTTFSVKESPVIYDQIQSWLAMCVTGAVATSGSPSVYTWAFTRSITVDPNPDSRTIERRISEGANHIDNEWAYAMLSQIRFIYEPDQPLRFSADGFARRIQASTLTAAQALPTIEYPPAALGVLSIDTSWAGLGGTPVVAQVLRAEVIFKSGLGPKMTLDGRADLDFTTYVLNPEEVNVEVNLTLFVKTSSGQFATEKTAAEAGTLRAVRLYVAGTGSRALTLDMLCKHQDASIQTIGSKDGQEVVEMKLVGATDATNFFKATVVNATTTVV